MPHFNTQDLVKLDKIDRLNLINSCTGYKSANMIATKSKDGITNVAVFSSITHLGSNPAMVGFILRPTTVPRHTYSNIKETGYFTINHITESHIAAAHQSSASYDKDKSEFETTELESEYLNDISIPFVKNSPVRLYCKYLNEYKIEENNTIHLIAQIEEIFVEEKLLESDYWIRLDKGNVMAINGLDGYAKPSLIDRFEYARPNIPLKSKL